MIYKNKMSHNKIHRNIIEGHLFYKYDLILVKSMIVSDCENPLLNI